MAMRWAFRRLKTSSIMALSLGAGVQQTGIDPPGSLPLPPDSVTEHPAAAEGAPPAPGGGDVGGALEPPEPPRGEGAGLAPEPATGPLPPEPPLPPLPAMLPASPPVRPPAAALPSCPPAPRGGKFASLSTRPAPPPRGEEARSSIEPPKLPSSASSSSSRRSSESAAPMQPLLFAQANRRRTTRPFESNGLSLFPARRVMPNRNANTPSITSPLLPSEPAAIEHPTSDRSGSPADGRFPGSIGAHNFS